MNSTKSKTKQFVAIALGITMALAFVVGGAVSPAQAATIEELTAQINSLLSTIAGLQSQLSTVQGGSSSSASGHVFSANLTIGSTGADVTALQQILVSKGYLTMPAGVSMGYFGALTKAAVIKWQAASGISPAAGFVGPISRAALNSMSGTTGGTTGGTTVPPAGSTLAVSAATQPAPQLAPGSASRVPFTTFTLTAGASDVTVNSVTVTRVGPAQDVSFAGVVLLDENGIQIGVAKTLNSNHQASLGEPFVIKAGTSRTLTIGGNMAVIATLALHAGEVPAFQVTSINTSAPVVGSLPITGTGQVINGTLVLGSATTYVSSFDPNVASSQNIGTTGFRFAGIRVLAGSNEDIRIRSIRWNQSGSASAGDLANITTVVDGVKYPTTLSADGKYYTTNFGSGIVISKGFSKDIFVEGDFVGSSSAARTVQFDIYKTTDLYVSGETFMYGITPVPGGNTASAATTASQFITSDGTTSGSAGTPWFSGSTITVSAGSVTTVTNAVSVAAQNVAVNVPNQSLGGFTTDLKGEAISVQSTIFEFNFGSADATTRLLTSVSLVDGNGAVVAGPVDATDVAGTHQRVTFTDTITFPLGKQTYTLKGKIDVDSTNGDTLTASTTPSSGWTTITGQTTGNAISLSGIGLVTMNPMTIRTADLVVTASANPAAQAVIAGTVGHLFTNLQFDASQSGEDVRFSNVPLTLTAGAGTYTTVSGCQLFDGATPLNTGSNVINPTAANAGAESFTLDSALIVAKGTIKTVGVKCNISSAATGAFTWSMTSTDVLTDWATSVTGVTSSQTVTPTGAGTGAAMTVGTASLAVSTDASSPGYTITSAGATGVTLGVAKFRATNDSINLQRIGLRLTNTASSSSSDLVQVTLWDGATQVGTAVFTGSNVLATSTLTSPVSLPKDTDKTITIKGNLSAIGSSEAVNVSGHLVAVNVESNTNTYGTGVGSGATINSTGSTAVAGARVFKSYPTLALDTLGSSGAADNKLLRFKVTAGSAGSISIAEINFTVATSSTNYAAFPTGVNVFGFSDSSYSQPISGVSSGGQLSASNVAPTLTAVSITPQTSAAVATFIEVPAGQTRYFEVRSTGGTGSGASWSLTTTLTGDSAFPSAPPLLVFCDYDSTTVAPTCNSNSGQSSSTAQQFLATSTAMTLAQNFVWSPNSTTTSALVDTDWTNGFGLPGLPSSGITQTRSN
ncbi:MAG: hypothetical protein A2664_04500 [Candidatus Taylorbacteria bacterium RIFCSPHIGHO2_01_FULL_46_22b]|uniref:Peptidoglycan binding-like domain-containing protein n=1 Tax=Candidatus Taylorbacteria bacterium RIFCSPHIGHO2_01_FULL_46_22b TaxID=1802301 RepID=A0A1G2M4F0_9BACT|nr:MAG: hypothetical protein A2664_04500 [Candidatus Taylorbacteria bacterium RIFCSPHIGHO2_01_FULL_46_22b]